MERAEYGAGDSADWTTIAAHEAFGAEDKLPELDAACRAWFRFFINSGFWNFSRRIWRALTCQLRDRKSVV